MQQKDDSIQPPLHMTTTTTSSARPCTPVPGGVSLGHSRKTSDMSIVSDMTTGPECDLQELLSTYAAADNELTNGISKLQQTSPSELSTQTELIHIYQGRLLASLDEIRAYFASTQVIPPTPNRYRESVFFSAQALSSGFHIRGMESHTMELKGVADVLCASMESLRGVMRSVIHDDFMLDVISKLPLEQLVEYKAIERVLVAQKEFDAAYEAFRLEITTRYLQNRAFDDTQAASFPSHPQSARLLSLFMQTLKEATTTTQPLIDREALASCDPAVMIAIPRLAVVKALGHGLDIPTSWGWSQHLSEDGDDMDSTVKLRQVSAAMQSLDPERLYHLCKILVVGAEDSLSPIDSDDQLLSLYRMTCRIADGMGRGKRARHVCRTIGKAIVAWEERK